ncbi:hypothetical protein V8F20_011187 [Naviculisporaceae sp. PSN 640]
MVPWCDGSRPVFVHVALTWGPVFSADEWQKNTSRRRMSSCVTCRDFKDLTLSCAYWLSTIVRIRIRKVIFRGIKEKQKEETPDSSQLDEQLDSFGSDLTVCWVPYDASINGCVNVASNKGVAKSVVPDEEGRAVSGHWRCGGLCISNTPGDLVGLALVEARQNRPSIGGRGGWLTCSREGGDHAKNRQQPKFSHGHLNPQNRRPSFIGGVILVPQNVLGPQVQYHRKARL